MDNEVELREFVKNLPGNLGLLAAHVQLHPDVAKNMCDHLAARARAVLVTCPWYCSCGWTGTDHQEHMATTGHAVRNFALTDAGEGK